LLDRAPDEAQRLEARTRLGAAVERAIHLVEQLLALARSEPQDAAMDFEKVDLAAAAAEAIKDTHDLALARNIDLGLDAAPGLYIQGNRETLRTLARNLVDNAVRYTPRGGTVQLRCRSTARDALLEVSDTGPGIAAADRERVFDRFYRRAAAQEDGTGLGLAIVKAIAERHGARLDLGETPGGGLQVVVSFPRSS
jgi:signal transduction histidine kinase